MLKGFIELLIVILLIIGIMISIWEWLPTAIKVIVVLISIYGIMKKLSR